MAFFDKATDGSIFPLWTHPIQESRTTSRSYGEFDIAYLLIRARRRSLSALVRISHGQAAGLNFADILQQPISNDSDPFDLISATASLLLNWSTVPHRAQENRLTPLGRETITP